MTLPAEQTTNPNGTLSTNIGGKVLHTIWNLPNDFFSQKILDNAYNFRDKLQIIINESEYVKDKNIPNSFFSSRDVKIAEQILQYDQSLSEENINFLQNIINCSTYHHYEIKMPFQDFNKNEIITCAKTLLVLPYISNLDTSPIQRTFNKWFNLSDKGAEKIETICEGNIYMSSPLDFNDRFDSQIHVTDNFYETLCSELKANPNEDNKFQLKLVLNLLIAKLRICCFSKKNPISSNSTNMWGLYGGGGSGIVISYSYADLLLCFQQYYHTEEQNKSFNEVDYLKDYNPSETIKEVVINTLNQESTTNFNPRIKTPIAKFIYTKSHTWEHEDELRFIFFIDSKLAEEAASYIKNSPQNEDSILKALDYLKDKNKNEAFLKPAQVILGWNCNELDDNIVKLRIFCREKEITVIKLKGKINYDKGIFDYDILPAVN